MRHVVAFLLVLSSVVFPVGIAEAACISVVSGSPWQNAGFATQTGTFTATFTASVATASKEAFIGVSNGAQTQASGFAATVRFSNSGTIQARAGGSFVGSIAYSPGVSYSFRLVVNVPAHTYSAFVTAPGAAERAIASNIAFRSEQQGVTSLNNRGIQANASNQTLTVCDFVVAGSGGGGSTPVATSTPTRTPVPGATATPTPTRTPTSVPVPPATGLIGFAAVNGMGRSTTTGGAGGSTVTVSNATAFLNAIGSASPMIVQVSGMITLPGPMHDVASNKTIVGIGSSGGLTGGGLNLSTVQNVIIRNLTITNCPDDCINLQESTHHVWIDHNDLSRQTDGALDIKRGSDFVTVSWNHFHDSDKNSLVGHSDSNASQDVGHLRITYHHNWFNGTVQRNPRVRFGEPVHVFNNYYLNVTGYGVASQMNAGVLVEGNFFENVTLPTRNDVAGDPGRIVARNNVVVNSDPVFSFGSVQEPRTFYAYTVDNPNGVPAAVRAGAGVGKI